MTDRSLPAFSGLVKSAALETRNLANAASLDQWLESALREKAPADGSRSEREVAAERWVMSVGRRWMLRQGAAESLTESAAEAIAPSQPWVFKALSEGRSVHALLLKDEERELFLTAIDWLLSNDGPALGSDWSRIAFPQALKAHDDWVAEMARAERKRAEALGATPAMEGCELACFVRDEPALADWAWVRVGSKAALAREGSMMKHCVGSYADKVAQEKVIIWSLRDPAGKPWVTVEARPSSSLASGALSTSKDGSLELAQIKGPANQTPRAEHARALPELTRHLESIGRPVVAAGSDLNKTGARLSPAWTGLPPGRLWLPADPAMDNAMLELAGGSPSATREPAALFCCEMGYSGALRHIIAALSDAEAISLNRSLLAKEIARALEDSSARRSLAAKPPSPLSAPAAKSRSLADFFARAEALGARLDGLAPKEALEALFHRQAAGFKDLRAPESASLGPPDSALSPRVAELLAQERHSEAARAYIAGAEPAVALAVAHALANISAMGADGAAANPKIAPLELLPIFETATRAGFASRSLAAARVILDASPACDSDGSRPEASRLAQAAAQALKTRAVADELAQRPDLIATLTGDNADWTKASTLPRMSAWLKEMGRSEPETLSLGVCFLIEALSELPALYDPKGQAMRKGAKRGLGRLILDAAQLDDLGRDILIDAISGMRAYRGGPLDSSAPSFQERLQARRQAACEAPRTAPLAPA